MKQRDLENSALMWLTLATRCDEHSPVGARELALALASAHMQAAENAYIDAENAYIDAYCVEAAR